MVRLIQQQSPERDTFMPIVLDEDAYLIEIPNEDSPDDEELEARLECL